MIFTWGIGGLDWYFRHLKTSEMEGASNITIPAFWLEHYDRKGDVYSVKHGPGTAKARDFNVTPFDFSRKESVAYA